MTLTRDELRRRLRRADPAAGRELEGNDRVRMRAMLVATAARHQARPRVAAVFALATAAAAVVTILALLPTAGVREVGNAAPEAAVRPTRIYFTGPEGTKIQWFVNNPDSKELGS